MPQEDISFQTSDNVTLRGWFITPTTASSKPLPCLVMSHGFSALKEMDLDAFANYFTSNLAITCLVYDNRNFGASDNAPSSPRQEVIPSLQCSDISDAITYAQGRADVDKAKIGIWGSSFSGGNVLWVAAADRRVKVVLSQVPLVNGWETMHRLVRPDFMAGMSDLFQEDRLARAAGAKPTMIPVVDENPLATSALPSPDSYVFFKEWEKKSSWKNEVTLRSVEEARNYDPSTHIQHISPTPLLMTVMDNDVCVPTDLALKGYAKALEPKELHILPGGHFEGYTGPNFEKNVTRQTEFLKKTLCA